MNHEDRSTGFDLRKVLSLQEIEIMTEVLRIILYYAAISSPPVTYLVIAETRERFCSWLRSSKLPTYAVFTYVLLSPNRFTARRLIV
jgi:hypothetical protein